MLAYTNTRMKLRHGVGAALPRVGSAPNTDIVGSAYDAVSDTIFGSDTVFLLDVWRRVDVDLIVAVAIVENRVIREKKSHREKKELERKHNINLGLINRKVPSLVLACQIDTHF